MDIREDGTDFTRCLIGVNEKEKKEAAKGIMANTTTLLRNKCTYEIYPVVTRPDIILEAVTAHTAEETMISGTAAYKGATNAA